MIRPSRRQRASRPTRQQAFALHGRIAARNALSTRLLRGGGAALLASLLAAAAGARPEVQAAALGAAFVAVAALPVRGEQQRALRFIRERAGLSYETWLELDAETSVDPFGFVEAVRERAVDSVRDVRPPERPAWWLPALAAALALLLFPLTRPTGPGRSAAPGPSSTMASRAAPQQDAPAPAPPSQVPQRVPGRPGSGGVGQHESAQGTAGQGSGQASDPQLLSQYLQSLAGPGSGAATSAQGGGAAPAGVGGAPSDTQPGAASGAAPAPSNPGGPSSSQSGAGAQSPSSQSGSSGPTSQSGAGGPSPSSQSGSSGPTSQPPGSGAAPKSPPPSNDRSSPPQSAPPQGGGGSSQRSGGSSATSGQQQPSGGNATSQGTRPGGNAASQALGGSQQGRTPGQLEQGSAQGGSLPGADRARGSGAGGNQPSAPGAPGTPVQGAGTPQFLPGSVAPGGQSASGTLRLPGSKDVTLPPGSSIASYRRAAEQAMTEGNVPLEYQDVMRRYFR